MTALYLLHKIEIDNSNDKVLVIEQRETYVRDEIFVIRNGQRHENTPPYDVIKLLKTITVDGKTLYQKIKDVEQKGFKYACHTNLPWFFQANCISDIQNDFEKVLDDDGDDYTTRMLVKIRDFELFLEDNFLLKGGHIIRSPEKETKISFSMDNDNRNIVIKDKILFLSKDVTKIYKDANIEPKLYIFGADGGNSFTRRHLSKLANNQELIKYDFYNKPREPDWVLNKLSEYTKYTRSFGTVMHVKIPIKLLKNLNHIFIFILDFMRMKFQ